MSVGIRRSDQEYAAEFIENRLRELAENGFGFDDSLDFTDGNFKGFLYYHYSDDEDTSAPINVEARRLGVCVFTNSQNATLFACNADARFFKEQHHAEKRVAMVADTAMAITDLCVRNAQEARAASVAKSNGQPKVPIRRSGRLRFIGESGAQYLSAWEAAEAGEPFHGIVVLRPSRKRVQCLM